MHARPVPPHPESVTLIDPSRKGTRMLTKRATVWAAVSGLAGTCMLGISFAINTGPPAGASGAQVAAFGQQHHDAILWGSWLQAVGPVLITVFALSVVMLAGATARLAGWMTLFGAATLMTVSLIEITGYIGTVHTSPATMPGTSLALIHSVQHLWFIVAAPALWLPLGLVILGSSVLPRILGILALVLAAGYVLAGVFTLFDLTVPPAVQVAAGVVPALWWLAAAGTLLRRTRQAPPAADLPSGVAAAGHETAGRL
jgi:hypothetical protein